MRVALSHDYLTQYGGAERVLVALHDLFADAPIHTSLVDYSALPAEAKSWNVQVLGPQWLPPKHHRALLPFYPRIFENAQLAPGLDAVIADSSAWAHRVHAPKGAALVCYCHSPARFLYGDADYLAPAGVTSGLQMVTTPLFARLRSSDRRAAARVDRYIANSRAVADRIKRAYRRSATVVYPPVDVDRFAPPQPVAAEPWYLVLSRLVPHKRVDLAIDACTKRGIPLKVVGTGRSLEELQQRAGPSVEVLGYRSDDEVVDLIRRCRALILPGAEDFGMTAIEAQAAGRPVIAYAAGGALESVVPEETGIFFREQTTDELLDAIVRSERVAWEPARATANAARFGIERFNREILTEVEAAIAAKRSAR